MAEIYDSGAFFLFLLLLILWDANRLLIGWFAASNEREKLRYAWKNQWYNKYHAFQAQWRWNILFHGNPRKFLFTKSKFGIFIGGVKEANKQYKPLPYRLHITYLLGASNLQNYYKIKKNPSLWHLLIFLFIFAEAFLSFMHKELTKHKSNYFCARRFCQINGIK